MFIKIPLLMTLFVVFQTGCVSGLSDEVLGKISIQFQQLYDSVHGCLIKIEDSAKDHQSQEKSSRTKIEYKVQVGLKTVALAAQHIIMHLQDKSATKKSTTEELTPLYNLFLDLKKDIGEELKKIGHPEQVADLDACHTKAHGILDEIFKLFS